MQELQELNERLSATLYIRTHTLAQLNALQGTKDAAAEAQRVELVAQLEIMDWDCRTIKEQITRVEAEAKALLDDLSRKVSMTAEQVLKQLPDR